MALSTAKAEATARDLKEVLEKRGFAVVESAVAKGRRLAIDDDMSIEILAQDGVSKDIFGNSNDSFSPHEVQFAIDTAVATHLEVAKVMVSLGKYGFDLKIGEGATLGAAQLAAADAEVTRYSLGWPTKSA